MSESAIDLDRLLELRLVVARSGEMDLARWWNTTGQLGKLGAATLRRGFPRTHRFAQARSVFAVAAHRCATHRSPDISPPPAVKAALESRLEAPTPGGAKKTAARGGGAR